MNKILPVKNIGHTLLVSLFCLACCCARAQSENTRASNWYQLQQLTALAGVDSSYLSAAQKTKLQSLTVDMSPTALCAKASSTPCSPGNPLPITGLKLSGNRTSAATVKLDWETKSEYNSRGFVLQRQSFSNPLEFDSIYYVNGQGTSYGPSKYAYTDMNSNIAVSFYRVKEVDIDGDSTFSNIVAIDGASAGFSVYVAPNPATSSTAAFYIVGTSTTPTGFMITNAMGQVIARQNDLPLSGNTYVPLNGYHLATGFYIVTVFNSKAQISQKFIIY